MKKLIPLFFACMFLTSCGSDDDEYHTPTNGLDAGRDFINFSLKGKFTTAKKYMLLTEDNNYWFDKVSRDYNQYSEKDKNGYSEASITILQIMDVVADSVLVINYSNSYINRPQKLKVVKYNGEWKVDFTYTFTGNN